MTKVTFLSLDGHKFSFETNEKNQDIALKKAEEKLSELGYDYYNYSLNSIETEEEN